MSSMRWSIIEDAIYNWIATASGLPSTNILWGMQNAPRPATDPWISMRIASIKTVGVDWLNVQDNPSPSAGAEILQIARGQRRCVLTLQCFAASGTGTAGPQAILNDVLSSTRLPSIDDALGAAFIGIAKIGDVKPIDGVLNSTRFEPRAIAEVGFYTTSEMVETATFIEHVEITNLTTGEVFTV